MFMIICSIGYFTDDEWFDRMRSLYDEIGQVLPGNKKTPSVQNTIEKFLYPLLVNKS